MRLSLPAVLIFYGLMAAGAVLWAWLREEPGLLVHGEGAIGPLASIGTGLGLGLLTALASRLLVLRSGRMRHLALCMARLLGPLDRRAIVVIAVCSALGEELLFRGAMQPSWGFVVTSLLFGAAHIGPDLGFLPWTLMALVLGFALGGLLLLTGNVLAPILAHFTINYFNLHLVEAVRRMSVDESARRW